MEKNNEKQIIFTATKNGDGLSIEMNCKGINQLLTLTVATLRAVIQGLQRSGDDKESVMRFISCAITKAFEVTGYSETFFSLVANEILGKYMNWIVDADE